MERDKDLPEGVIDAEPTGGWQSAEAAAEPSGPVESAETQQGLDPDLATDDQTDR
jgi:hypothetical protein